MRRPAPVSSLLDYLRLGPRGEVRAYGDDDVAQLGGARFKVLPRLELSGAVGSPRAAEEDEDGALAAPAQPPAARRLLHQTGDAALATQRGGQRDVRRELAHTDGLAAARLHDVALLLERGELGVTHVCAGGERALDRSELGGARALLGVEAANGALLVARQSSRQQAGGNARAAASSDGALTRQRRRQGRDAEARGRGAESQRDAKEAPIAHEWRNGAVMSTMKFRTSCVFYGRDTIVLSTLQP